MINFCVEKFDELGALLEGVDGVLQMIAGPPFYILTVIAAFRAYPK